MSNSGNVTNGIGADGPRGLMPDEALNAPGKVEDLTKRYVSLDAYRGLIMICLISVGFGLPAVQGESLAGIPGRPGKACSLGRADLLGPDPAGFHVHGRNGHAFCLCQAEIDGAFP